MSVVLLLKDLGVMGKLSKLTNSSQTHHKLMEIATLAATAVAVLVPFVKEGAESFVGEAGKSLWEFIQKKFSKDDKAQKKLEKLKEAPEDKTSQERLKNELMDYLEEDSDFAAHIQKLLQDLPEEAKTNIQNISGSDNIGMQDITGSSININKG